MLKNPSESFDIAQNERKSDVAEKSPLMLSFVEAFFAFFTPNSLIPPARNRQPAVEIVGSANQREMGEGLGKISGVLAARTDLFGE